MTRRRAQAYRSAELSDLTRQLLYAPPEKRAEVVRHAERFHDELEERKNYPIDFVVYRLTRRRVPPSENVMLVGEALGPDLRLLIDALSRSIPMPPDADDPGETTAELADRLGVSTKTVGRWRDAGLRWRWCVREPGGKAVVWITRSALGAFEERQAGRVSAASAYSRLSATERRRLIERARRLADATDVPPHVILGHLSKRSGRSVEAIRQLIAQHDAEPGAAQVFADRAGPLTLRQKRVIDRAYRAGIGVSAIARRFRKTRSTVYRAIHERRAERVLARKIDAVVLPIFDRADADEVILRPIRQAGRARRLDPGVIRGLPAELQPIYAVPIASDAVTRSLVVRYNFLKHRERQVQGQLKAHPVRAVDLDRFDELAKQADQTRGQIIAGLLPVVLSVVRRQIDPQRAGDIGEVIVMLDRGNAVLIEEIERFDPALSHTLESVLTNRLLRVLAHQDNCAEIDPQKLLDRLRNAGFEAP